MTGGFIAFLVIPVNEKSRTAVGGVAGWAEGQTHWSTVFTIVRLADSPIACGDGPNVLYGFQRRIVKPFIMARVARRDVFAVE